MEEELVLSTDVHKLLKLASGQGFDWQLLLYSYVVVVVAAAAVLDDDDFQVLQMKLEAEEKVSDAANDEMDDQLEEEGMHTLLDFQEEGIVVVVVLSGHDAVDDYNHTQIHCKQSDEDLPDAEAVVQGCYILEGEVDAVEEDAVGQGILQDKHWEEESVVEEGDNPEESVDCFLTTKDHSKGSVSLTSDTKSNKLLNWKKWIPEN